MHKEVIAEMVKGFEIAISALRKELSRVRTGRANPSMLDGIRVDYYGTMTPLNQVGAVKVPDPRMITIQPWDKNMIAHIERAIMSADLGLNPSNDGVLVRIPIPALTGERRRELSKGVKEMAEKTKVAVRNHRRDANELIKSLQKDGEVPEDDAHKAIDRVQELTNEHIKKIDDIVAEKDKEIMEL
ncbi:MAG: ribosome recycling factor [Myxococcota bacterium]|jgi:ribosome recycling factor|nr:ribosome recycling factor [Myxococcota bacterium]